MQTNNKYGIPNDVYLLAGQILEDYVCLEMSLDQLVRKYECKERYIRKLIQLYDDRTIPVQVSFAVPPSTSKFLKPNLITDTYKEYIIKCKMQYMETALFANDNNKVQMANAENMERDLLYKTLRLYNDTFKK